MAMNTEELLIDEEVQQQLDNEELHLSESEITNHEALQEKRASLPGTNLPEKRRRYRNLFGNIGKLISLGRRRSSGAESSQSDNEDLKSPASSNDTSTNRSESESLDLVVPEESSDEQEIKEKMDYDMADGHSQFDENEEGATVGTTIPEESEVESTSNSEPNLIQLDSEMDLADATAAENNNMQTEENTDEVVEEAEITPVNSTESVNLEPEYSNNETCENKTDSVIAEETIKENTKPLLCQQMSESDSGYHGSSSTSPLHEIADTKQDERADQEDNLKDESSSSVFQSDEGQTERESGDGAEQTGSIDIPACMQTSEILEIKELESFEKAEEILLDKNADIEDIDVKVESLWKKQNKKNVDDAVEEVNESDVSEEVEILKSTNDENVTAETEPATEQQKSIDIANPSEGKSDLIDTNDEQTVVAPVEEQTEKSNNSSNDTANAEQESTDIVDVSEATQQQSDMTENTTISGQINPDSNRPTSRLPVRQDHRMSPQRRRSSQSPVKLTKPYTPVKIDMTERGAIEAATAPADQLTTPDRYNLTNQEIRNGKHLVEKDITVALDSHQQNKKKCSKKVHFGPPPAPDQILRYSAEEVSPQEQPTGMNGLNGPISYGEPQSQIKKYIEIGHHNDNKAKVVRQKTSDCIELQHTTKPTIYAEKTALKNITVKQTLASRKRLEKLHDEAVRQLELQDDSIYMTPLQRKDCEVKELRRQLDEACFIIEQRELELDVFHHEKEKSIEEAVQVRDEKIAGLKVQIKNLENDLHSLQSAHAELQQKKQELEEIVEQMKEEMQRRELRHQDLYLEMYRKGQNSAKFERQDEIEKLAVLEPDKVALEELIEKLEITQQDLQKWQSVKLESSYQDVERELVTESEAKIRFLRDSMYHYLTEKDKYQVAQHMTAIIGIFSFTDTQMKNIMKALDEKKKKGLL